MDQINRQDNIRTYVTVIARAAVASTIDVLFSSSNEWDVKNVSSVAMVYT